MAKNTTSNNSAKNVTSVTTGKGLLPWQERNIPVIAKDIENINLTLNTFLQQQMLLPTSPEIAEEYNRIYGIYLEKRTWIEQVGKGLIAYPDEITVPPLNVRFIPGVDQIEPYAYVYAYSYFLREVKETLRQALRMNSVPHGMVTDVIGVLQFRIQNTTVQELEALKTAYPELILNTWYPERETKQARQSKLSVSRVQPLRKVKGAIAAGTYSNSETVRKATPQELELLAASKAQHEENGLKDL
jgi:hypothetical protein